VADSEHLQKSLRRSARRLEAIAVELDNIEVSHVSSDEWLLVRARVGKLTAAFNESFAEVDRLIGITGAQARILRYLQLRLGEIVTKEELSGVAGIFEWARRVRELRMDHGWAIHSAETRADLHIGEYILELDHPDEQLARSWAVARKMKKLRSMGGAAPARVRLLEYLKAIYPNAGDSEQLSYVAGSPEQCIQCLEQLVEEGWRISGLPETGASGAFTVGLESLERDA
jgi:hypothetical protein